MRLDELVNELRGLGKRDEIGASALVRASGGLISKTTWVRYTSQPTDYLETPWGTRATMRAAIEIAQVKAIADTFRVAPRTVWLAVGESCGLPGMFDSDGLDAAVAKLPPGWWRLPDDPMLHLRRTAAVLMDAHETAAERDELRAEVERLRAEAATRTRRRTT